LKRENVESSSAGRIVARILHGEMLPAGLHEVKWDGRNERGNAVVSGVYFCRLVAGKETIARKMVLSR
jgi:flagellar hook assembly protein FlgD